MSLGWHQALFSGSFYWGGGATRLGFVLSLSELRVPEDGQQLKNIIPSHGVKWWRHLVQAPLMELWLTLPLFLGSWGGGEPPLSLYKIVSLDPTPLLRRFLYGLPWRQLDGRQWSSSVTCQPQGSPLSYQSRVLNRLWSWSEPVGGHCGLCDLPGHSVFVQSF